MAKYTCFRNNCFPNHIESHRIFFIYWIVWLSARVPAQKSLASLLYIGGWAYNFPSKRAFPKHVSVHQQGAGEPCGLALLPCHSLHPWLLSADQHVAPPCVAEVQSSLLFLLLGGMMVADLFVQFGSLTERYAQDMLKICPRYAHDMPMICPRYAQDMHKICPRYAHDMPKICPIYAQYIL